MKTHKWELRYRQFMVSGWEWVAFILVAGLVILVAELIGR